MTPFNDQLRLIVLEAFESLGRMFPLMEDETVTNPGVMERCVAVDFSGPIQGIFLMGYDDRLRRVIAEAMLERTASIQEEEDALKEMANVICGNILPYVAGPASLFKLSPPRYASFSEQTKIYGPETAQACVAFPAGSAHIKIFLHGSK